MKTIFSNGLETISQPRVRPELAEKPHIDLTWAAREAAMMESMADVERLFETLKRSPNTNQGRRTTIGTKRAIVDDQYISTYQKCLERTTRTTLGNSNGSATQETHSNDGQVALTK